MPFHYKAFILVMASTLVMFVLAKPLFMRFMIEEDFARRRNLWLALTVAAFLIPNFWAFLLVAAVLVGVTTARETNPAALYFFLLLALPPIREVISGFGLVKQLFAIDHLRLLSIVLLLPAAIRLASSGNHDEAEGWPDGARRLGWQMPDVLLLSYALLQIILMFPTESVTASGRRMFLLSIDLLLPYYVISRTCRTREMLVEAMASFALAMIVLAPLAAAEFVGKWILYAGLQERWGTAYMIGYVTRGDFLRAQVTGGHAIVFGYAMAVAFGFWLFLQSRVESIGLRRLALLVLLVGLAAPLARGPWLGALVILMLFLSLGPNAGARFLKTMAIILVLGGVVMATPYGTKLIEHLPFVGTVDDTSVSYRQQLAELSWTLIQQNPLFGSPYFLAYMESLRQGEGIIDMVNAYAGIALSYGLIGMALYLGFFGVVSWRCLVAARERLEWDHDFSLMGASLVACIIGSLVVLATTSNYLSVPYVLLGMAGLARAYADLARREVWAEPAPEFQPTETFGAAPLPERRW